MYFHKYSKVSSEGECRNKPLSHQVINGIILQEEEIYYKEIIIK